MSILITLTIAFMSALASIVFHYWSLRFVTQSTKQFTSHFLMSVTVVICLFIIHFAEIMWFSVVLFISYTEIGLAGFQQPVSLTMIDYIQIAAVSFTTLGGFFSAPIDELALLIALISLTGFMMLTWSATYYYNIFSNSDLRSK
ncbi:hypothetical protein R1T43_03960 [Alteromonas sp. CI.11.F.A3]|uniref:hypothetical protein n=1 Tax=Alteromonas sp. CI.11.F.A3 TaxID=3079555 RepID=UPI002942A81A|nr:hypothetical protein [Alteromonas sp. CI.11.F.A3]WOI38204.1 hypothetical protein R1T43_03960 [Alteromonas sp. CI.11.F.A3]